ncbi:MAG: tRNA (adenosine(37)-N6)-threonylcarbamoyltransferase complex dimerization subunit type 1 TsaB [Bacteroidales bacterium]
MAKILCIETATNICSVAVGIDGKVAALKESTRKNSHAEVLTSFIQEALDEAKINKEDLDAIAVSKGPGSYTGLRIGVSTAKGLAYALSCPVITVTTLQSMAMGVILENQIAISENTLLCPMIDARRMEVYCGLYNKEGKEVNPIEAKIIDEESFSDILQDKEIIYFGDGAQKCLDSFENKAHTHYYEKGFPTASAIITLAEKKFEASEFEDIAYFEPYYLKDFVAGKPRVKGLR